jgi:hypothetical protein
MLFISGAGLEETENGFKAGMIAKQGGNPIG